MFRITVEPILFSTMLLIVIYSIISKEYIYHRIAMDMGLANGTKSTPCNAQNVSHHIEILQAEVDALSSEWTLYLNVAGFLPSLLTTTLLGAWGDLAGRRLPLLFSCFGLLILIVVYIIVIHFELHVAYLLLGRLLSGLCGDFPVALGSSYAYIGDITTHRSRTVRLAFGEASLALGGIAGSLVSGVWVDAQGYENPLWLLFASMVFCMLYISLILPESVILQDTSIFRRLGKLFSLAPLRGMWKFLKFDCNRTTKVLAVVFCFFVSETVFIGIPDVLAVVELSLPLCFTNSMVGYAAACITGSALIGLIFLKLISGHLNDFLIVFLSIISSIASALVCSFAQTSWLIFVGICLGWLQGLTVVICRSQASRLADSAEQGSVFALFACFQSLAGIASSLVFNGIYSATVASFEPAVFFVAIGLNCLILVIFGFTYRSVRHDLKAKAATGYQPINDVNNTDGVTPVGA